MLKPKTEFGGNFMKVVLEQPQKNLDNHDTIALGEGRGG